MVDWINGITQCLNMCAYQSFSAAATQADAERRARTRVGQKLYKLTSGVRAYDAFHCARTICVNATRDARGICTNLGVMMPLRVRVSGGCLCVVTHTHDTHINTSFWPEQRIPFMCSCRAVSMYYYVYCVCVVCCVCVMCACSNKCVDNARIMNKRACILYAVFLFVLTPLLYSVMHAILTQTRACLTSTK